ncbi:non-canonical purine NTP pyrophosphatase [Sulfodiicoccus acidiphilus]|uniref:dITP/XTP pyrophosphatase n=1 Tax=Sulfodiicoccus acidiphilus TaxID=1670455 RepID=A0A348B763_9CREN|nr:XTP/dITP diphosphatase [Sulfodiicoccus acidiphilus]BBD74015.1 non-canonical purine NTP pyrophosphatase [Sulfodiicoccus acidiphilus]GGT87150.1 non-canonical purine NTP pyrophosphatase [Sulfodiicoccus acidiphilus]
MSERGKLSIVSANRHKFLELAELAKDRGIKVEFANLSKVEIQANSLLEVSRTGAMLAFSQLQRPLIVEDAGLFVEALNGFPGPYSSYVFKTIGIEGILDLVRDRTDRSAFFQSVITYVDREQVVSFEGKVEGEIALSPRGRGGFGFDPIFIPRGSKLTFAEMDVRTKNLLSHRAVAFSKFLDFYAPRR